MNTNISERLKPEPNVEISISYFDGLKGLKTIEEHTKDLIFDFDKKDFELILQLWKQLVSPFQDRNKQLKYFVLVGLAYACKESILL
jgi:hypothetical protein